MELKVLGSGEPPDEFADDLKILLSREPSEWEVLAKWFLATDSFDVEEAVSSPGVAASSLLPEEFRKCAWGLQFLLERWHASGLPLSDLQRDLLSLGYSTHQIDRLGALMDRLSGVRHRVYTNFMRYQHENAVLPTLEDINVVCDIRPVFEDYVYPVPDKSAISHTKLLGFSYMVLMELSAEGPEGETQKLAFQMTEGTLANFQAALRRASQQLDILKVNTSGLPTEHT